MEERLRPAEHGLEAEAEAEAEAVTAVRLARLAALTPSERLERVHALCAQVDAFTREAGSLGAA